MRTVIKKTELIHVSCKI